MPTQDIIGYLAENRQDLTLDTNADLFQMVADLERAGLKTVRIEETKIFGMTTGASVQWVTLETEEWADLVHAAIVSASVDQMMDEVNGK